MRAIVKIDLTFEEFGDILGGVWEFIDNFVILGISLKFWLLALLVIGVLSMFTRGKRD